MLYIEVWPDETKQESGVDQFEKEKKKIRTWIKKIL